jgi:DNA-binding transcriptional MocR family regulator
MVALARPRGGMFVSAGWPGPSTRERNGRLVAERALRQGILLAPGEFFTLAPPASTWFRFNVAYAAHDALLGFLHSIR